MAFVLEDQCPRVNFQPVNQPPLSSFPSSQSPSLPQCWGSAMHAALALGFSCLLFALFISLFPSLLKKYSLFSNGHFTEHHWFCLAFLADKEEKEVDERRKPFGQAWQIPLSTVDHRTLILFLITDCCSNCLYTEEQLGGGEFVLNSRSFLLVFIDTRNSQVPLCNTSVLAEHWCCIVSEQYRQWFWSF